METIPETGFTLTQHDNGSGHLAWWVTDQRGVRRRASEAEAWLWERLQEARAALAEHEDQQAVVRADAAWRDTRRGRK